MGVEVSWDDDEKTAIRYDLSGRWQWEEFFPMFQKATEMIAPLDRKIPFIVNPADEVTRGGYIPPNLLSRLRDLNKNPHPNTGITYVVGTPLLKTLYNIARKVYPAVAERYAYVTSLEEARLLIKEKIEKQAKQQSANSSTGSN